jgi:hypothetical protein
MATSTTKQATGITDQMIMNNGQFKINPTYEVEVTENADLTANFVIRGHLTDLNESAQLVDYIKNQTITASVVTATA